MRINKRTARRLSYAIVFAAARGAATTAGTSLAGLVIWWIANR